MNLHVCQALRCRQEIESTRPFCSDHFRMLDPELQADLEKTDPACSFFKTLLAQGVGFIGKRERIL